MSNAIQSVIKITRHENIIKINMGSGSSWIVKAELVKNIYQNIVKNYEGENEKAIRYF